MSWMFDIGPPKGDEPYWDEMKVDWLGKWILDQVPEDQRDTTVRAIISTYAANSDDWANDREPQPFLRAYKHVSNGSIRLECTIEESTKDGNLNGPLISGGIYMPGGIEMGSNSVIVYGLPDSAIRTLKIGEPLGDFQALSIDIYRDRILEDVKITEDIALLSFAPMPQVTWNEGIMWTDHIY